MGLELLLKRARIVDRAKVGRQGVPCATGSDGKGAPSQGGTTYKWHKDGRRIRRTEVAATGY